MLFKTCKFNMQSEGICHYDLIANATSKPAYEDMIVGSVTPQMVIFMSLTPTQLFVAIFLDERFKIF